MLDFVSYNSTLTWLPLCWNATYWNAPWYLSAMAGRWVKKSHFLRSGPFCVRSRLVQSGRVDQS